MSIQSWLHSLLSIFFTIQLLFNLIVTLLFPSSAFFFYIISSFSQLFHYLLCLLILWVGIGISWFFLLCSFHIIFHVLLLHRSWKNRRIVKKKVYRWINLIISQLMMTSRWKMELASVASGGIGINKKSINW